MTRRAAAAIVVVALTACAGSAERRTTTTSGATGVTTSPRPSSSTTMTTATATTTAMTTATTSTSTTTTSTVPATTVPVTLPMPAVWNVAWVGGSEAVLRDVSLPAAATRLTPTLTGVPATYTAFAKIDPSPAETAAFARQAADEGANALVVTLNPQWIHERQCEGIDSPHTRFACLLAPGDPVGLADISALLDELATINLPTLLVMQPTSSDAATNPELVPLIADVRRQLTELVPDSRLLAIADVEFTAGRAEFAEGVGFYDMVHPTPAGADPLAVELTTQLEQLLTSLVA